MQIALTPFPKGVDVKQILQYRRRKHTIAPCKLGAPESIQQSESTVVTMSMMKNKDTERNLLVQEFQPSGEELPKEATDQYVTKSNPHHDAAESGTELAGKVNVAPVQEEIPPHRTGQFVQEELGAPKAQGSNMIVHSGTKTVAVAGSKKIPSWRTYILLCSYQNER
jgi:hypothetical protein